MITPKIVSFIKLTPAMLDAIVKKYRELEKEAPIPPAPKVI